MKREKSVNLKDTAMLLLSLCLVVIPTATQAMAQGGTVLTLEQFLQSAEANAPAIQQSKAALAAQDFRQTHSWMNVGPKLQGTYNRFFLEEEN